MRVGFCDRERMAGLYGFRFQDAGSGIVGEGGVFLAGCESRLGLGDTCGRQSTQMPFRGSDVVVVDTIGGN